MNWQPVEDPNRSAIQEAHVEDLDVTYAILENSQYVDVEPDGFILWRVSDDKGMGLVGERDGVVGVVCGIGSFCAIGAPPGTKRSTIEEIKELAELDFKLNIEE
jgi:hypothetical protein